MSSTFLRYQYVQPKATMQLNLNCRYLSHIRRIKFLSSTEKAQCGPVNCGFEMYEWQSGIFWPIYRGNNSHQVYVWTRRTAGRKLRAQIETP